MSGIGTILVSEDHIDPKRDDGYIIYKLGWLHPLVDGKRVISLLWGNGKGVPGLSAYEVAVVNGFVGTQAEWLASLVGDDGRQPEFSVQAGWHCWRYVGDSVWIQLYQVPSSQIQSDWTQAINTALDYIKNKPTLGTISPKGYWSGTLAAYTAIITKDADTIYFIEEE